MISRSPTLRQFPVRDFQIFLVSVIAQGRCTNLLLNKVPPSSDALRHTSAQDDSRLAQSTIMQTRVDEAI